MGRTPILRGLIVACIVHVSSSAFAADKNLELPPDGSEENVAPPAHTGPQIAARTGVSLPMGQRTTLAGDDLSKTFGAQVPLVLDLMFKQGAHFAIGAYVGGSIGGGGSRLQCGTQYDCTAASFRFGPQVTYAFRPGQRINPWVGLGVGLEWAGVRASPHTTAASSVRQDDPSRGGGDKASVTYFGVDFARLTLGADWRASELVGFGPVLEGAVSQYMSVATEQGAVSSSGPLGNAAVHGWVTLGARAVLLP